jgi:hypothetical protein
VDDVLCVGDTAAINNAINGIKAKYSIKEVGKMCEYVGCTIMPDDSKLFIIQPDLIRKMEKVFGKYTSDLTRYNTPTAPGMSVA